MPLYLLLQIYKYEKWQGTTLPKMEPGEILPVKSLGVEVGETQVSVWSPASRAPSPRKSEPCSHRNSSVKRS